MSNHELVEDSYGQKLVKRTDLDGKIWFFPQSESNSDYQRYLRWLEDPNAEDTPVSTLQ